MTARDGRGLNASVSSLCLFYIFASASGLIFIYIKDFFVLLWQGKGGFN